VQLDPPPAPDAMDPPDDDPCAASQSVMRVPGQVGFAHEFSAAAGNDTRITAINRRASFGRMQLVGGSLWADIIGSLNSTGGRCVSLNLEDRSLNFRHSSNAVVPDALSFSWPLLRTIRTASEFTRSLGVDLRWRALGGLRHPTRPMRGKAEVGTDLLDRRH